MSFSATFKLVQWLEGKGRVGEKYGMTQLTWHNLGHEGRVELASDGEIAQACRQLWDSCKIHDPELMTQRSVFDLLGEPADSVAYQCFYNIPWKAFHTLLRKAVGLEDGETFDDKTFYAIRKIPPSKLADKILELQDEHYKKNASPENLNGLRNRVKRVDAWLAGKSPTLIEPPKPEVSDVGWPFCI